MSIRYFLISLLGKLPTTETIENKDQDLRKEYDEFIKFGESDELKHYKELKSWFDSKEFEKEKAQLKSLTYKSSPEFQLEKEYFALCKDKSLKNYLSIAGTDIPQKYSDIESSGLPQNFAELEAFIKSPEYKQARNQHKKENSESYQKELAYLELKGNGQLKEYQQLKKSKSFADYNKVKNSDLPNKYNDLKIQVESDDFKERKAYLLSTDKFEKTESYQKLQEYLSLEKSDKIRWFLTASKDNRFDEIKKWELTFSDEFDGNKIDRKKWMTRYFWGDALLNQGYSLAADNHWYTDGNNLELGNSTLKIKTQKEKADGLSWDTHYGFVPKSFEFTSGLISTGQSFRQKHGRFEAKIRFSCAEGIYHAFWLVGDKMLPEVDIFRKKGDTPTNLQGAFYWENDQPGKAKKKLSKIGGLKLDTEFYILGIEWDEQKITWKINGIPYKDQKNNLPLLPLYIVFSSGVNGKTDDSKLPVTFEIDWVRCWALKENS